MTEDSEFEKHFYCPICNDVFMTPRLYDCGHTICESCMKKIDSIDQEKVTSPFDIPIYSCPICRNKSITSYKNRPINRQLLDVFLENENYSKNYYTKNNEQDINIITKCKNINFSHLAFKNKYIKTEKYYKMIVPLLYEASINGKSKIVITTNTKDLQVISKMLSKKLFNHGIYKIIASPREFIIYILPENSGYSNELINSNYDNTRLLSNEEEVNLQSEYNNLFTITSPINTLSTIRNFNFSRI